MDRDESDGRVEKRRDVDRPESRIGKIKEWARGVRRDTHALFIAARDPRTPRGAVVLATLILAYALSPIDLIPDVIPILGYLDDLLLIPIGLALVIRMIPPEVWSDCRARAAAEIADGKRLPTSRAGAAAIVILWVVAFILTAWGVRRLVD